MWCCCIVLHNIKLFNLIDVSGVDKILKTPLRQHHDSFSSLIELNIITFHCIAGLLYYTVLVRHIH